ncbi:MAG: glycoside hydrolase family 3 protein [Muribaculaceae bacterium]|nr:glycoside hydrolase family 3 protein [Roseburia sp.]MCM1431645.1 glycoside hydrolase family 3 protein [Muribaculaceae bacterium]MCM1491683.1 glycoside hydrolase family 3 protein [Muribaculaceae bacterium]
MKPGTRKKFLAILLAAAMLLSGCGTAEKQTPDGSMQSSQESVSDGGGSLSGEPDKSVYMDPDADVEERIAALLAQMTLEEKVAQMVQPEQAALDASKVTEYGIGSVLSGGGSAPASGNTAADWQNRINELKQAALDSRLGIPLLYGVDAVHGNNNVYGATVFPHNIALGAANDPKLMEELGALTASEVRAIGVQWTFAPTLGNPQSERWGRTYECFSERAEEIPTLSNPYIRGLQGAKDTGDYLTGSRVLACAKHYIGEGYTTDGVNQGNVDMSPEEFDALLSSGVLDPYTGAIDEGVLTVMVSFNSVNGLKCHENKHLVQDLLKDQLGFEGLVISDYNGIQQVSGASYKEQIANAVNAGVDLCMEVTTWETVMMYLIELVDEGGVTQERIDDAVSRILRVKFKAGLFEEEVGGATEQQCLSDFGSDAHREIARRAVRESLVLLKNDTVGSSTATEALANAASISVSGQKAYDIGSQCGGWTISWQGSSGKITQGTTLIEGFANAVGENVRLSHNVDGSIKEGADAVIAVFGEVPYAETNGDSPADSLKPAAADIEMLTALRANLDAMPDRSEIPVIGIVITGRPINIAEYMDMFDAVIIAWLPGTEGAGVADVLFGEYDFTGTLSYTWMKDMNDIDKKHADGNGDLVLFPYGYGLNKAGTALTRSR